MEDNPITHDFFSPACPDCGSADFTVATQRNNFESSDPDEKPFQEEHHVSTSRTFECRKCSHRWAETVPHIR